MDHRWRDMVFAATALAAVAAAPVALAEPAPVLPAEQSDVAVMPPAHPHRAILWTSFTAPGVYIVDADKGRMEGYLPKSEWSSFAIDPAGKYYYVAETMWTHATRGERLDMVTVYDSSTLNLVKEIPLPGRLLVVAKAQTFAVSESGRYGYVYNMAPASSVVVVDLPQRKVAGVVEAPGCALVLPYGERAFVSICGDGALASFVLDDKLRAKVTRSARLFDPGADPVFDSMALDPQSRRAFLISYDGMVYPVRLQDAPEADEPWSLQAAAGVRRPEPLETNPADIAWRPGGGQLVAYHAASQRLFVLMHVGEAWTHKKEGSELWVLDAQARRLLKRVPLEKAFSNVSVSQDGKPQVYLTGFSPDLTVLDPETGQIVRTVDRVGGGQVATAGPIR